MNDSALGWRLSEISRSRASGLPQIDTWPDALDAGAWCMSQDLISLAGTAEFAALAPDQQRRLSFFELVNFFSMNVHGERALLGALAGQLYGRAFEPGWEYLHHFIDEENKHMQYFGSFCLRYAGKIYPEKKLVIPREYEPGEGEFLVFAKILIFEEIIDHYNVRMAADTDVVPIVRTINRLHHEDEVRHLAFGRAVTRRLHERWRPSWSDATAAAVDAYLSAYLQATWRELCNPQAYIDAGVAAGTGGTFTAAQALARAAWTASHGRRVDGSRRIVQFFAALGIRLDHTSPGT